MHHTLNVLFGLTLIGFVFLQESTAQDAKTELEGTWELIRFERDGKEIKPQKDTKLVITGAMFVVKVGDKVIAGGTIKLDPTKKPKAIDSAYTEGPAKDKSFKGIYHLDGDILSFCRPGSPDQERPTEFKTTPEKRGFVSVYKRETP